MHKNYFIFLVAIGNQINSQKRVTSLIIRTLHLNSEV